MGREVGGVGSMKAKALEKCSRNQINESESSEKKLHVMNKFRVKQQERWSMEAGREREGRGKRAEVPRHLGTRGKRKTQ